MTTEMLFGGEDTAWRACTAALTEAGWPVSLAPECYVKHGLTIMGKSGISQDLVKLPYKQRT